MKKLPVLLAIFAIALAANAAQAGRSSGGTGGGYFYLTAKADTDTDGDAALVSSPMYSTLAACQAAEASASDVVQECVARCNPASPSTGYFLDQKLDSDSDDPSKNLYQAIGPYGFLSDCQAGIADAQAAGMTDVLSACMVASFSCKSH